MADLAERQFEDAYIGRILACILAQCFESFGQVSAGFPIVPRGVYGQSETAQVEGDLNGRRAVPTIHHQRFGRDQLGLVEGMQGEQDIRVVGVNGR